MNPAIFFEEAYKEAKKAKLICRPNPAVGAIIVKKSIIIARGYTQVYGGFHAEKIAFNQVGDKKKLKGAEMYVTLMPCCHYGKTPPCSELIRDYQIAKVCIATPDLNPMVMGKTESFFKKNNIVYTYNFPKEIALKLFELNKDFFYRQVFKKPFVIAKYAMTLDGKMATYKGDSKWITERKAREKVHLSRAVSDGIVIGAKTAIKDDPLLSSRLSLNVKQPLRIVVCTQNKFLKKCKNLFSNQAKTVFLSKKSFWFLNYQLKKNKQTIFFYKKTPYSKETLMALAQRFKLNSIYIEGGAKTLGAFLEEEVLDQMDVYIGLKILGDGKYALSPFIRKMKKQWIKEAFSVIKRKVVTFDDTVFISVYTKEKAMERLKKKVLKVNR